MRVIIESTSIALAAALLGAAVTYLRLRTRLRALTQGLVRARVSLHFAESLVHGSATPRGRELLGERLDRLHHELDRMRATLPARRP